MPPNSQPANPTHGGTAASHPFSLKTKSPQIASSAPAAAAGGLAHRGGRTLRRASARAGNEGASPSGPGHFQPQQPPLQYLCGKIHSTWQKS